MLPSDSASYKHRILKAVSNSSVFLAVILQILWLPSSAFPRSSKQEQPLQALGSFSKIGEVYINDLPVTVAESTIFVGDKLRTGENGVASFTVSGKGTLKFSPNTFAVFTGAEQYVADLKSGTVVMSSFSGPSGLALRVGDFIVVPAVQEQQTTAKVERTVAGAASVSCLEGNVSVVSRQGAAGLLLQAGQSSAISSAGQLNPESEGLPAAAPTPSPETPQPTQPEPGAPTPPTANPPTTTNPPPQQKNRKGWIILGLAGAGVAGIAAAAAGGGGGHQPVSPSSP